MSNEIKNMLEEQNKAFSEFKAANNSSYKQLQDQVDKLEQAFNRPPGYSGDSFGGSSPRELNAALREFLKTGNDARLNSLSTVDDGGYIINPQRANTIAQKLFDQSPIRRLSRVITLTSGDAFEEPVDYSELEAQWIGEENARPATAGPSLGLLRVPLNESYCLIPITQKLIDTTGFDLWAWIEDRVVDRFARQEGTGFVVGTGMEQPMGILTYGVSSAADSSRSWGTLQYVPSGQPATITSDSLIDLVYSLRAPYRRGASWLMSSDTARTISKFKDGSGSYLWRESLAAGQPDSLCGFPVEYSEDLPSIAAGEIPIIFGNFKLGYTVIDRLGTRFLRDPFSSKPFVLVYCYRRVGGGCSNTEALKLLRVGAN